jgi:hypothetical protein
MAHELKCGKCGSPVSAAAPSCPICGLVFGVVQSTDSAAPSGSLLPPSVRILAYISLAAAAFVFSVTHLAFLPVGYEGALVLGGLSAWLCILAAAASVIASAVLWFKGKGVGPIPSALSFVALGVLWATMYLPG